MSATDKVTVDRELLVRLIVEAEGVAEAMDYLSGVGGAHLTARLASLAEEVGISAGVFPAEELLNLDGEHEGRFAAVSEAGIRRRDELLGRTEVPV